MIGNGKLTAEVEEKVVVVKVKAGSLSVERVKRQRVVVVLLVCGGDCWWW